MNHNTGRAACFSVTALANDDVRPELEFGSGSSGMNDTVTKTRYRVGGMDCAACATKIETAVRRIDGVREVHVATSSSTMTVTHSAAVGLGSDIVGVAHSEAEVQTMAAALETGSAHPRAKAILARAANDGIVIPAISEASALKHAPSCCPRTSCALSKS